MKIVLLLKKIGIFFSLVLGFSTLSAVFFTFFYSYSHQTKITNFVREKLDTFQKNTSILEKIYVISNNSLTSFSNSYEKIEKEIDHQLLNLKNIKIEIEKTKDKFEKNKNDFLNFKEIENWEDKLKKFNENNKDIEKKLNDVNEKIVDSLKLINPNFDIDSLNLKDIPDDKNFLKDVPVDKTNLNIDDLLNSKDIPQINNIKTINKNSNITLYFHNSKQENNNQKKSSNFKVLDQLIEAVDQITKQTENLRNLFSKSNKIIKLSISGFYNNRIVIRTKTILERLNTIIGDIKNPNSELWKNFAYISKVIMIATGAILALFIIAVLVKFIIYKNVNGKYVKRSNSKKELIDHVRKILKKYPDLYYLIEQYNR